MNNIPTNVPYIAYEASMTRMERITKRIFYSLLVSVIILVVTNVLWVYAWFNSSYDYETPPRADSAQVDDLGTVP